MSDNKNDILHVEGGKPLNGTIKVRGAKNFVSKAMVAALLAPGTSVLKNVPEIRDVHVVSDLLRLHGVDVTVPACAATPFVAPVSTWSAGSPPSVKNSASTSPSWAWAA